MKHLRIFILFTLLPCTFFSCSHATDGDAIRNAVAREMAQYPESRLQDLYKSFFQDRFGPGHIISDRQSSLDYINYEYETADTLLLPYCVPCGWEGNYVRVSLAALRDSLLTADELTDALVGSAIPVLDEDVEQWKSEWKSIVSIIEEDFPDIPLLQEDKQVLDSLLASGEYAWHHSEAYGRAYRPHYRIIRKELADSLLNRN